MPARIIWLAVSPATGLPIAELPGMRLSSSLPTLIGGSGGTANLQLPITDRLPTNWRMATQPREVILVAQYDDADETIVWAGVPESRTVGSGPTIDLTVVDTHGWLDRCQPRSFVPDGDSPSQAALSVQGFMWKWNEGILVGNDFREVTEFVNDPAESSLGTLQRIAADYAPTEWMMRWRWGVHHVFSDRRRLLLDFMAGRQLGRRLTGQSEVPAYLTRVPWSITEDWRAGRGVKQVTAVNHPGGDADPISVTYPLIPPQGTLPTWEAIQEDSSDTGFLLQQAEGRVAELEDGTETIAVDIDLADSDIVVGKDIQLGDDVLIDVENPDLPELSQSLAVRCIGWTIEASENSGEIVRITPVLTGGGVDDEQ